MSIDPHLQFLMGQRAGLSFYDIKMACIGYNCSGLEKFNKNLKVSPTFFMLLDSCINPPNCKNEGFIAKNCTCTCPNGVIGINCESYVSQSKLN